VTLARQLAGGRTAGEHIVHQHHVPVGHGIVHAKGTADRQLALGPRTFGQRAGVQHPHRRTGVHRETQLPGRPAGDGLGMVEAALAQASRVQRNR